jgi:alkylhydroperoxidase family enzyme
MSTTPPAQAPVAAAGPDTLTALVEKDAVSRTELHARYGPLLELVRTLIGVVPNCDPVMEIWPAAFRTYNVMVPNFLNLPFSVLGVGGAPAQITGLGMYVASRTAECSYCSAHTCSFALRRGARVETVAEVLAAAEAGAPPSLVGRATISAAERATVTVAQALARIPCELTSAQRTALVGAVGANHAEWIALGVIMMGFLNKWMDAMGVQLEASTHAEVADVMGPSWSAGVAGRDLGDALAARTAPPRRDSLGTKLRILPRLPTAVRMDRVWQKGVPDRWPAVGAYLRERTGHDFPVLGRLRHARARRAAASMLLMNLDPADTHVGLRVKVLAGIIFATVVSDAPLEATVRALGPKAGVTAAEMDAAAAYADGKAGNGSAVASEQLLLRLALAVSPSPAAVDATVVSAVRDAGVPSAGVVELVTWIAVLQMLHRLIGWTG